MTPWVLSAALRADGIYRPAAASAERGTGTIDVFARTTQPRLCGDATLAVHSRGVINSENPEAESCTRSENWNGGWETLEKSDSGGTEPHGAATAAFPRQQSLASLSRENEYPVIVGVGNEKLAC